jgi:hypothetical protein
MSEKNGTPKLGIVGSGAQSDMIKKALASGNVPIIGAKQSFEEGLETVKATMDKQFTHYILFAANSEEDKVLSLSNGNPDDMPYLVAQLLDTPELRAVVLSAIDVSIGLGASKAQVGTDEGEKDGS